MFFLKLCWILQVIFVFLTRISSFLLNQISVRFCVIITDLYHLLLLSVGNLSGCQWSIRETASIHYLSFNEILFFLERHQVNIILSKFYLKWKCLFWVQTCDRSNCCLSFHVISINVTHVLLLLKSHWGSLMCNSTEVFSRGKCNKTPVSEPIVLLYDDRDLYFIIIP